MRTGSNVTEMSTDTLLNETPVAVDLDFDLGDVLRCTRESCGMEAQWIGRTPCGCGGDVPACDPCKTAHDEWIRSEVYGYVLCSLCGAPCYPDDMKWIPL